MRRFELSDERSRKFWEIDVRQAELRIRFGRLGTTGTTRTKTCSSEAAAAAEAAKLIREKTSKGYAEAALARAETEPGLSQVELEAIAGLLELAAPEYDGHSSNDYHVPANDGNRSVITATIEYGGRVLAATEARRFGDSIERDGRIFIWDYWLMQYLAHRCRMILAAREGPVGLSDAETGLLATLLDDLARNEFNFFESVPGGEDFSLAATSEHKALLMATMRNAGAEDLNTKLSDLENADDIVSAYAVDVLRWLAVRCRAAEGVPPRVPPAAGATSEDQETRGWKAVNRLGVLKGWVSEKTLMKRATEMDSSWIPAYAKNDADLETYASGGNPFREYKKPDVPGRPPFAPDVRGTLLRHEQKKRERNVILCLFGNGPEAEWQAEYDRLAAYRFWGLVTEIQAAGHVDFGECVAVLADCVYLGHAQQANYLARLLHWSLTSGNVRMDDALPLYQWWMRVCFEQLQLDFDPNRLPAYALRKDLYATDECFGEPILNDLIARWRDPELSPISERLIWLCDYYTHRTRYTSPPEPKTEFGSSWIPARLPIVVLAWFRLREALGLRNPDIDHPLMKARYARLYPPRAVFSDELLQRVIARLRREELPTLGDFEDPTIPEPKRWSISPHHRESKPYESVSLAPHWAPGFALNLRLPLDCVERSLPETAQFAERQTGTEFRFSAYRNPGIAVPDWAEIVLSQFARAAPGAERVATRYTVRSQKWSGMAEEFQGIADAGPEPRHYCVVAGKAYATLLVIHVIAQTDVFSAQGAFYRWLFEWQFFLNNPEAIAVIPGRRQDVPGFERIAPDPSWMDAEKQFEIGLHHYRGTGANEAAQIASRDRTLAAAWFERAAEQDHGKSQFNLAMILKNAEGVPQDVQAALGWARKARLRGVESAPQLVRELETMESKAKPFWKLW